MITPHYNDELVPARDTADRAGRGVAPEDARTSDGQTVLRAIRGDARAELSQDQIAELRQRIQDGVYNAPEIAGQVAQRLLSSGDLDLIKE